MIRLPLSEDQASRAWRENWIANIRQQARRQVPEWLRELRAERLAEKPRTAVATVTANPVTPLPRTRGNTEPIAKLTDMLPIVKLLEPISVRDTRELVSSAVRWFFEKHGFLPTVIALNPLRCLAISSQAFFAIDCEDIGGYTVEVQQDSYLACDVVCCQGRRYAWEVGITDYYL